jgi:hypothetical protein
LGLRTGLASVDKSFRLPGIKTRLLSSKTPNIVAASAELFQIPLWEEIIRIPKENFQNTHGVNSHAQPVIQKHVRIPSGAISRFSRTCKEKTRQSH